MIDEKEHEYLDDPKVGHPDVRTRLKDAAYFFLGNGLIQAGIQVAPGGEGSPYGLAIMNPEQLKSKRESLTFDAETGFEKTMIRIIAGEKSYSAQANEIHAEWKKELGVPAVFVRWEKPKFAVKEIFFCPDRTTPILTRNVEIQNKTDEEFSFQLETGVRDQKINIDLNLKSGEVAKIGLKYELNAKMNEVKVEKTDLIFPVRENIRYWEKAASVSFGNSMLDYFFDAAQFQLSSVVSRTGKVDASIWQYNREWVRDHSFMALGLVLSGHFDSARILLERLITDFVSEDGDCIDSSVKREPDEVELDQNGELLFVLKEYVLWSGDLDLIEKYWEKLKKTAEFPLQQVFRHEASGLFFNTREFWERHAIHGIEPGIELLYQIFPAIGLESAAILARLLSKNEQAEVWEKQAAMIKENVLNHPKFALVRERGFVKRLNLDGTVQETINPQKESIPEGVPLWEDIPHYLDPDLGAALPIALGFVSPQSEVTRATMEQFEELWNQSWDIGGYGRYHESSEADAAGPWPFPSLFVARAAMETGEYEKVWKILNWMNQIPGAISGAWFEMYGNRIAPPYPQVGITPWTWGEILTLCVHHILGIKPEEKYLHFRPKLLPGLENVEASFPLRNNRINFKIRVDAGVKAPEFHGDFLFVKAEDGGILIPYLDRNINVEAVLPKLVD